MPNYDYRSPDGTITEHFFPMGKAPDKVGDAERVVSGSAGISFKGAGWTKVLYEHTPKDYARVKKIDWDKMAKDNNCM